MPIYEPEAHSTLCCYGQIYLADWSIPKFTNAPGVPPRCFGAPVGIETIPQYSEIF